MTFFRRLIVITFSAVLFTVAAQHGFPQDNLPRSLAVFEDRTPLLDNPTDLAVALDHVQQENADLAAAAESHMQGRRRDLAAATGEEAQTFSTYRDLLRFPQASRGLPVALAGRVESTERAMLGSRKATLVSIAPDDTPGGRFVVLIPDDVKQPGSGDEVRCVGIFLKLAELPNQTSVAPLVVASEIITKTNSGGVRPDRDLWANVRHRTRGVLASESSAYYHLLRLAATADQVSLAAAADEQVARRRDEVPKFRDREPFPTFVDMFQNPEAYEGEVVTLTGYAREVRKYPAGENTEGLENLYEAWVYTDDSQSNPAVVIASDAVGDLPVGSDLQVPVRATGYFFKIYGYRAQDTTRIAPMILAGRIERLPEPPVASAPWWLAGLFAAFLAAMLAWVVVSYVGSRRRRPVVVSEAPPDFSNLTTDAERQE